MKHLLIIILSGGLLFTSCNHADKTEMAKLTTDINTTHIKTEAVESTNENTEINILGFVLSDVESKPAFKTGGVIYNTFVKEGDVVKKGQLLATLNMAEIDAQVRQAEEGLAKTERDLKRAKNMHADSVATLEQLQNATTAFEMSKRSVDIARFNRSYSEIRSPISGKILKQIMREGEIVGPGIPVFAIMGVGNKDWKINAGLIDRDWARVNQGDQVEIKIDAYPGQIFSGTISNKSSAGNSASGTFDIDVKFKSQPEKLAAGLITKLSIRPKSNTKMAVIPINAIVKTDGSTAIAFTVKDGKAKKLNLRVAKILGDKIAISSGLDDVKEVVTIGAIYLEDGDKVSIE
ncbi:MAG: efflux RND transporter periplasmic adaptor subunit [Saprospiraceae bacterium]|nr:efflux RND transporter periplasmic adaptor subunit [Saprospiraceae bacterium]